MVDLGILGHREHQAHVAAHEEGQLPGLEEIVEAELVAVEGDGRAGRGCGSRSGRCSG